MNTVKHGLMEKDVKESMTQMTQVNSGTTGTFCFPIIASGRTTGTRFIDWAQQLLFHLRKPIKQYRSETINI